METMRETERDDTCPICGTELERYAAYETVAGETVISHVEYDCPNAYRHTHRDLAGVDLPITAAVREN